MLFANVAHKQQMAVQAAHGHNTGVVEVMVQAPCCKQIAVNEALCRRPTLSFTMLHWAEHTKHDYNKACMWNAGQTEDGG